MPRQQDDDISKTDFAWQLRLHSLAYLPNIDRFIDLRHPKAGRHILPVLNEAGRMLRDTSIQSCLAARAAYEAELAEIAKAEQQKAALAEQLAPAAIAPCRADLEGPQAVSQLADDFIVQTTRNDGVVWADLVRLGWTGPQLKRHSDAARIVAQRRQEKQTAEVMA
ncbi:phospholipase [Bradyrhizobium barranii subsp. barranii]|uniref:Phospholipase n=1 Tax=Bradyrhizobium barranii subsp. barranii TaxID=2823807 RepID=A0A939S6G2_9BRAD|nr:phospholipase [Bradyrhizobium barranii]UEM09044.1 phospholipase [Bradyrhizobium barranii subsp. barranii]